MVSVVSRHPKKFTAGGSVLGAILAAVFLVEGGLVDHPDDPGGVTNYGITEQVARKHGYHGPMDQLPPALAEEIYVADYIVRPGFYPLLEIQPALAEKLIDAGVNTGTTRPSRWFQQSLNALSRGGRDYPLIAVDGIVGPQTLQTYQRLEQTRGKVLACELVLKLLDGYQATYYVSLEHLHSFTPGWISHRIGNVPLQKCTYYGLD